jgi:hypothetical protein
VLRVFDFASPDSTSPMRFQTSVPQQALFMLNSPFMAERARDFLARPELAQMAEPARKISELHALAYQRPPTRHELELGRQFVAQPLAGELELPPGAAWSYGTGEVEPGGQRVSNWRPLPRFVKDQWQWAEKLPSPDGQWTLLNARGGHPGADAANAAIRRWTAPVDGVIQVTGQVEHTSDRGDGIRARIVSSRSGELGSWVAKNGPQATEVAALKVARGDTLDFVVEPQTSADSDGFLWAPKLTLIRADDGGVAPSNRRWDARQDFGGKREFPRPLTPWEQYAQVLLSANEFVFVD